MDAPSYAHFAKVKIVVVEVGVLPPFSALVVPEFSLPTFAAPDKSFFSVGTIAEPFVFIFRIIWIVLSLWRRPCFEPNNLIRMNVFDSLLLRQLNLPPCIWVNRLIHV